MGGFLLPTAVVLSTAAFVSRRLSRSIQRFPQKPASTTTSHLDYDYLGDDGQIDTLLEPRPPPIFGFWGGVSIGLICGFWLGVKTTGLLAHPLIQWVLARNRLSHDTAPPGRGDGDGDGDTLCKANDVSPSHDANGTSRGRGDTQRNLVRTTHQNYSSTVERPPSTVHRRPSYPSQTASNPPAWDSASVDSWSRNSASGQCFGCAVLPPTLPA
eukprot:Gregarina_sp_Pseudo_9__864@NODE_1554_length_1500_cov_11_728268_g1441_i0_p1_GENE_NODE_1554_length_1500_cov_11_728268_g1441_i0NODE_1554_length_1500_cov_11_728268_g1441_i0_p1_ORF_typecomplete_len213_score32_36_NODE_1554_length_1500_cov_11_728268_g1441_i0176814